MTTLEYAHTEPPRDGCNFCHREIAPHESFHRITVGMNEEGPGGTFSLASSTVEEVSELFVCKACHPAIDTLVNRFLAALWARIQPRSDALPPPEAIATPYGLTTPDAVAAGAEMLAVAARAYPASPEGFALGVIVGKLAREGLTTEQIGGLVEQIVGSPIHAQASA